MIYLAISIVYVIVLVLSLLAEYGTIRLIWLLSDDKLRGLHLISSIVLQIVFWPIAMPVNLVLNKVRSEK